MALEVATGSFNIGTGGVGTTVSITSLSFEPKVIIFGWSGRTAVGQAEGSHKFGMGYMISAADRGGVTTQSQHAAANANADQQTFDDACIKLLTTAGAVDGAADFDAFLSNGFRLIIDDQFVADYLVTYLALGGVDLTDVKSVTVTVPAATGDQDITTVGFQPDCAIAFGTSGYAINVTGAFSNFAIGVAAGASPSSYCLAGCSDNNLATMNTMSYCIDEFLAEVFLDAVALRGSLTAWLSNGFRINWVEVASGIITRVLCLKGGRYAVGDILSQTDTNNFSETGAGFTPKALMFGSHNKVKSTTNVTQAGDERCIGFAVSPTERNAFGIVDKDAVADADVGVAVHTDQCYSNQSLDATIVVEGLMDLVSMDADGFTSVMDDADPAQAFVWYLAFGDAPGWGFPFRRRPLPQAILAR